MNALAPTAAAALVPCAPSLELAREFSARPRPFGQPVSFGAPLGSSVAEMAALAYPDAERRALAVAWVDGEWTPREAWDQCPDAGHAVEFTQRPAKSAARKLVRTLVTIATVAIVFFVTGSPTLALQIGGAVGGLLGNLLANAIVPPSSNRQEKIEAPQTYSIEGVRNSARLFQPARVVLGRHRVFADLQAPYYQEIVGEDVYLRVLLCWGVGDYALSDFKSGDTPVANLAGVQIQHQLTQDAPEQTLYTGLPQTEQVGADLATDWTTRRTAADAEEIELLFAFPRGLGQTDDDGEPEVKSVTIQIRYRPVAEDGEAEQPWRETTAGTVPESDDAARSTVQGIFNRRDLLDRIGSSSALGDYHTALDQSQGGGSVPLSRTFSRKDFKPFPVSIRFAVPPGRQYDIEVRRSQARDDAAGVANDVRWNALYTWRDGKPVPDRRFAVTALRFKASEEVSGVLDNLNAVIESLSPVAAPQTAADPSTATVADWSGALASSNPADMLLHATRGSHTDAPTPDAEIDWPAFARWHAICAAKGFTFDYVVDTQMRRGELLNIIAAAGRARALRIGGKLTVVPDVDQPEGPRLLFTPRNARQFTVSKVFPAPTDVLQVAFPNADKGWRQDERLVPLGGKTIDQAELFERFTLPGVTDTALIERHARWNAATAAAITLTGSFATDAEYLVCSFGDRIAVAHDILARTAGSSFIDAVERNEAGAVTAVILRDGIDMDALDGDTPVLRWRVVRHGTDGPVLSADRMDRVTPGAGAAAEDFGGGIRRFVFDAPLTDALRPEAGDLAVVGALGVESLDVVITRIGPDAAGGARIDWSLYVEGRDDGDTTVLDGTSGPVSPTPIDPRPPAPELVGSRGADGTVELGFHQDPSRPVDRFRVIRRDAQSAGAWEPLPDLPGTARSATVPVSDNRTPQDIRIVAVAPDGRESPALEVTDAVPGLPVPAPRGVSASVVTGGIPSIRFSADPVPDSGRLRELQLKYWIDGAESEAESVRVPSTDPRGVLTGLDADTDYRLAFAWVDRFGRRTAADLQPEVGPLSPVSEVTAAQVGGRSAAELDQLLQTLRDDIDNLQSGQQQP